MSSKGNKLVPKGARRRMQILLASTTTPDNIQRVAAFIFPEGGPVPDGMIQVSSATYSLSSPLLPGVQVVAAMPFSLSSPAIPSNLKRIAILPDP
jgi:hypothetical protein